MLVVCNRNSARRYGRDHSSDVHVVGRIVLNIWRLLRKEIKLPTYTQHMCCLQVISSHPPPLILVVIITAVAAPVSCFLQVLQRRVAQFPPHLLARWMKADVKGQSNVGLRSVAVMRPHMQETVFF